MGCSRNTGTDVKPSFGKDLKTHQLSIMFTSLKGIITTKQSNTWSMIVFFFQPFVTSANPDVLSSFILIHVYCLAHFLCIQAFLVILIIITHTHCTKSDSVPTGKGPDHLMALCEAKLPLSKRLCFITVEMGEQGFLAPGDQ